MDYDVWDRFCDLAMALRGPLDSLYLHFSGGETFLHFDAFVECLDVWKSRCSENGIDSRIAVCTNGVLLDDERLETCAGFDLELTFSIDGSTSTHNGGRPGVRGEPTHESAYRNWRRYRELIAAGQSKGACAVQSVIGGKGNLQETIRYWMDEDVTLFSALVAEPSRYARQLTASEWDEGRRRYLDDFAAFAEIQADRLGYPHFLTEYRGPSSLYTLWSKLFIERPNDAYCRPAVSMLAVDAEGRIYPCEGFFGFPEWAIGDLGIGLDADKRNEFLERLHEVRAGCANCSVHDLCGGGCVAADPRRGLVTNYEGGCEFITQVIAIAKSSYQRLSKRNG